MNAARTALALAVLATAPQAALGQQDPFGRGAWAMEAAASTLAEAWNYNLSREELAGVHVGVTRAVRDGIVLHAGPSLWYVSQRGSDAFVMGLSGGARWAVWRAGARALSLDLDVGGSRAESPVPPGGTRFNYIFQTGVSATWPLPRGARARAGVCWLHLSNNRPRERGRNPDVQAIGVHLGVLLPF